MRFRLSIAQTGHHWSTSQVCEHLRYVSRVLPSPPRVKHRLQGTASTVESFSKLSRQSPDVLLRFPLHVLLSSHRDHRTKATRTHEPAVDRKHNRQFQHPECFEIQTIWHSHSLLYLSPRCPLADLGRTRSKTTSRLNYVLWFSHSVVTARRFAR